MELVNVNDDFDPIPRLKSSPVPILFISFNQNDENCIHCGNEYSKTIFCQQKYCKKCLSHYLTHINDKGTHLDIYYKYYEINMSCSKHEITRTKESHIRKFCENCLEIIYFRQIPVQTPVHTPVHNFRGSYRSLNDDIIRNEYFCKLCFKENNRINMTKYKLCSNCYLISSGWIESTLTKKLIPVVYLPWWHNVSNCDTCNSKLIYTSNCQKYCRNCLIFYTGCRYCLTTNIIFGLTYQSQCKKCNKGIIVIFDITNIFSGNNDLDDFLINIRIEYLKVAEFVNNIENITKYFLLERTLDPIRQSYTIFMEWILYSQFLNIKEIAEGGFGIIYQATWLEGSINFDHFGILGKSKREGNETVILKRLKNSQDINKYFLNELKSNQYCYKVYHNVIRIYGFTKDPKLDDYVLVMQYASGGDLHRYLQKKFIEITWTEKINILWKISDGLKSIHNANYVHRDLHSGNILLNLKNSYTKEWLVGDLGLSQPANNTPTNNNEIYGVIPYIAPEVFKGSAFSKESDIYCMSMIMWELTTGCKPFSNIEHDHHLIYKIIDGERPEITEDTPECYANLMKSCWDPDPKKRPSISKIEKILSEWCYLPYINLLKQFQHAELKRKELINLKKLGPEFSEKPHPKVSYISKPLSFLISKYSSIRFLSKELEPDKDCISKELELDIDLESKPYVHGIKRKIEESNINHYDKKNGKQIKIG